MKKTLLLICLLAMLCSPAMAQFRKITQAEIDYLNRVHGLLYDALPHGHLGWKVVEYGKAFDASKYWCSEGEAQCLGTCPVSLGKKDPYQLDYKVDFTIPDDQKNSLISTGMAQLKDYTNAQQVATFLKSIAKTNLQVWIFTNDFGATDADLITYCPKTPPVKLNIPVKSVLAVMGLRSDACPLTAGGTPDMHANYTDNAIVVLGKPLLKTRHAIEENGIARDNYTVAFDNTKLNKLVTQNIVVKFIGDAKDIQAAVEAINWQKLSDMLEK
jgi:hypothetical protein